MGKNLDILEKYLPTGVNPSDLQKTAHLVLKKLKKEIPPPRLKVSEYKCESIIKAMCTTRMKDRIRKVYGN